MNKSESIANLAKALSEFQAKVTNPANTATNPFFKSKYAPLSDILTLVRPILGEFGLSIIQDPSTSGGDVTIKTTLLHLSGEFIESDPLTLKMEKVTAQGAGSAITYARRYAISAILGLSSEDDDDGNNAEGNGKKEEVKGKKESKKSEEPKVNAELVKIIDEINTTAISLTCDKTLIADAIKLHHSINGEKNANYNSIKDLTVANAVLAELKKLVK